MIFRDPCSDRPGETLSARRFRCPPPAYASFTALGKTTFRRSWMVASQRRGGLVVPSQRRPPFFFAPCARLFDPSAAECRNRPLFTCRRGAPAANPHTDRAHSLSHMWHVLGSEICRGFRGSCPPLPYGAIPALIVFATATPAPVTANAAVRRPRVGLVEPPPFSQPC